MLTPNSLEDRSFYSWGAGDLAWSFASSETRDVIQRAITLRNAPPPSTYARWTTSSNASIEERLYESLAGVKVYTSQVAMHMERELRSRLFAQLDSLLDPEEWVEEDEPLRQASFGTFLKVLFLFRPDRRPGLGISANGHLIGAWTHGDNRLTIECLPGDRARWVLTQDLRGSPELAAGETTVERLGAVLKPYDVDQWFKSGGR
jgi:hypothetical protein